MLTAVVSRRSKQGGEEQLVAVRPQVLSEAEHAFGNLFHRIHHIVRLARDGLGGHGDRLTSALTDLQRLLELVFDYVTPVEIELKPIACNRVAESLAAHLRAHAGVVTIAPCPAIEVLADPRVLSRSFHLMAKARTRALQAVAAVSVVALRGDVPDRAEFAVWAPGADDTGLNDEDGLAWQVAEHLIEIQGGELDQTVADNTLVCRVTLPLAQLRASHDAT